MDFLNYYKIRQIICLNSKLQQTCLVKQNLNFCKKFLYLKINFKIIKNHLKISKKTTKFVKKF